jgi:phosphoribosylformylglycinamidine (FGAM) synthase-like enzyme
VALDTVAIAEVTPGNPQPFAELGLKPDEYARIKEILGRRPTSSELAMYSVMWSEHCSYKSSKVHLKQFGEKAPKSDALLVGIGENAGVVDVGQGYAVTFKIESHNHPSFIEPYQGAATGVGGIVRDILTMGARPIAVMDPLRFGPADAPDTRRVLPGVIAGVGGYGNCLGLPNIGGEVTFDETYAGNPLVNALCVGVMKHSDIKLAKAAGAGNLVVLYGAKTGGDGIGGVSVLASETFGAGGSTKRPSVQVGDPFVEKVLIECSLEIFAEDLVVGIQDLGGAGLSCATSELASGGSGGMKVQLDKVPLRDPSLSPEEILMSESQERMCAIVEPSKIDRFLEICKKWDVTVTVIGEVTDGKHLEITWNGELIVDVPPRTVAHDGPIYNRPLAQPAYIDQVNGQRVDVPIPETAAEVKAAVLKLAAAPNLADKSWVTSQYDKYVQGNTIQSQPDDSGMVRGLADACLEMGLPVTGGNVSFYNQTGSVAILPTPVIGVLGVIQDVRTRTPMSFTKAGLDLYLVGETHEDLAGSEWAFLHNQRVGQSPDADLQREMRLIELLLEGNAFFAAAHDLSQGGLAAGLTEMVLRHKVGVTISLENAGVSLISETPGRVLVAIDPSQNARLEGLAVKHSIAITKLGITGGDSLTINDAAIS